MTVSEISSPPSNIKFSLTPSGSIRVDPLCSLYSKYKAIAGTEGFPIERPLMFTLLDLEYGVQDNIQHNYAEITPYMRSEAFKYYSGSQNEHLEFMVRFFAYDNPKKEVHASYEYLSALQYPWVDTEIGEDGYKYPPPRLMLSLNASVVKLGYIAAMNVTWFSPVGFDGVVNIAGNGQASTPMPVQVSFFCEVLLTFVVVGSEYNARSFRGVASGNQRMGNYDRLK